LHRTQARRRIDLDRDGALRRCIGWAFRRGAFEPDNFDSQYFPRRVG
jgi:hypothetical protein